MSKNGRLEGRKPHPDFLRNQMLLEGIDCRPMIEESIVSNQIGLLAGKGQSTCSPSYSRGFKRA